jgi:hypothetical protein
MKDCIRYIIIIIIIIILACDYDRNLKHFKRDLLFITNIKLQY